MTNFVEPPEAVMRAIAPDYQLGFDEQGRPTIRCQFGRVVMLAPDALVWQCTSRGTSSKRVGQLPFVTSVPHSGGVAFEFHPDNLPAVAAIVQPLPRRPRGFGR